MTETTAQTTRTAMLYGPGALRIEAVPLTAPGPGEVRIRVEAALTGGTSTKVYRRGYHARMGSPPRPFGHEGAGTIDAVGEEVTTWKIGDRVVPANSAACGRCKNCEHGRTAQCEDMIWLNGFFAEHLIVPARIVAQNLHRIPAGMPATTAALAETLADVVKGNDRTPARRGERVVVIGTGPIGLLWIRVLAASGAHVVAVGRRPERHELALALGAREAILAREFETTAAEADLVVEAVGSTEAWEMAIAAVAPGGRVNLFGGPERGTTITLDPQRLHYDELTITASFHHTPFHFAEALRLLEEGFVDPALLIQERLTLEALPAFFKQAAAGAGPLKAALTPNGA